jgi:acyl-CoA thioester hydrolase
MYQSNVNIRVRYAETDQMGYCYYGNYAMYYEVARVETLREIGFNYKSLEEDGVLLPVIEFNIKYLKPAFYDDQLKIICKIPIIPTLRIKFEYETYNEKKEMINFGSTTLVFLNKISKKPVNCPKPLLDKLNQYL